MKQNIIPANHPRAESLKLREKLIEGFHSGLVAEAGLMAHGRGEAFDYILGERTTDNASHAIRTAAALLLVSKKPVISVNGNAAALAGSELVELSKITGAKLEVNLFYRSPEREEAVAQVLQNAGAREVLGINPEESGVIPELSSERRRVDRRGILVSDVVLVPLEDGDRTEALARIGKKTIAIDLNPLARTAQKATITIVDNLVRAVPRLTETARTLGKLNKDQLGRIVSTFDNGKNLAEAIGAIESNLSQVAEKSTTISFGEKD